MDALWEKARENVRLANAVVGDGTPDDAKRALTTKMHATMGTVLAKLREERKRKRDGQTEPDLSDARLSKLAASTDHLPLRDYERLLHIVPRLVNVVTLAEAIPVAGTGLKLPLDLHRIASRCSNAYFAPRRFAAVQLAFDSPRCRVLVFHTGRLVGTGCAGPMQARLAIMRAARQLAVEADIHIMVRNFNVINQVGAVSIDARLDCDAFATTHSATSHYDRLSFVGLAWRPQGEPICCEIYSTGRANLPGSIRERQLLNAFARMAPELMRHSDKPHVADLVAPHLRAAHRPRQAKRDDESLPLGSVPPDAPAAVVRRTQTKAAAPAALAALAAPLAAAGLWDSIDSMDLGCDALPPLVATGAAGSDFLDDAGF